MSTGTQTIWPGRTCEGIINATVGADTPRRSVGVAAAAPPARPGASLTERFGEYDSHPSVFVVLANGLGTGLIDRPAAQKVFEAVVGNPLVGLRGSPDADSGFSWHTPGAVPCRSHIVRPLRVTGVSQPQPIHLTIELTFPSGPIAKRRFAGPFPNIQTAVLAACCLWGGRAGFGVTAAALVGQDGTRLELEQASQTCGQVDRALIESLLATKADEPRSPHGSAGGLEAGRHVQDRVSVAATPDAGGNPS